MAYNGWGIYDYGCGMYDLWVGHLWLNGWCNLISSPRLLHSFAAYTKDVFSKLSKARMKVWVIKAGYVRWINVYAVSNKRSGVQTTCMCLHAWIYLNNFGTQLSVVFQGCGILPCLCTFWHAFPTSPLIFLVIANYDYMQPVNMHLKVVK